MRLSTVARLSLGLVVLTICILLFAEMLGLIPSHSETVINNRKTVSESLAVYYTIAIQKENTLMTQQVTKILMDRNPDILSTAIRKNDGTFFFQTDYHNKYWKDAPQKNSTDTHLRVPVYLGTNVWGDIEVVFEPINRKGLYSIIENNLVQLILFVFLTGFIIYRFFLKKTLSHLDPSTVVPPRVTAAMNSLSEGVVIMDQNERIVLANSVFADKIKRSPSSLMGSKTSELNWTVPNTDEHITKFPWMEAISDGKVHPGFRLGLQIKPGHWKTFMVNGAPILDGAGKCRGVMATFDDVTEVEEQNETLRIMLEKLEKSQNEIQVKNKELEFLATRDPLTGCLNRRSFFETFDKTLSSSLRHKHSLSCIMFDIDHFKSINDNHGHAKGDDVLRGVAEVLESLVRQCDTVGRYGGEEFCVILPHTAIKDAALAADRFRIGLNTYDFSGLNVSASFGVSSVEFGALDSSSLIDQADQALYKAKTDGRNRVITWKQLKSDSHSDLKHDSASKPNKSVPDPDIKTKKTDILKNDDKNNNHIEALAMVNKSLVGSIGSSREMGLHASHENDTRSAVRLNKDEGWSDGKDNDKKKQVQFKPVSHAADILKQK